MTLNLINAASQASTNLPAVKISLILFTIAGILLTIALLSKAGFWNKFSDK